MTKPSVSRVTEEYDRAQALITDNGYGICGFLAKRIEAAIKLSGGRVIVNERSRGITIVRVPLLPRLA